ncbi:MAG: Sua5/YciO/YrdC/YwlC family protein, partial [Kiritimatiellia bacterium]
MNEARTRALRYLVRGAVQGVGFRPFVYREATARALRGWTINTPEGVEILIAGPPWQIDDFDAALRYNPPPAARIESIEASPCEDSDLPATFEIRASQLEGAHSATILPDLAMCTDCLRDISDPANRRYRYPFTNCINCGPRYSIMLGLPYDRDRTTMRAFTMCEGCRAEYENPADRRFHAQPNACPLCGPHLSLWNRDGQTIAERDEALKLAAQQIKDGRIVAVKGIGGFHLLVDATNDEAVRELRRRKHREEKPFAVMVRDVAAANAHANVAPEEQRWLTSPAAPIVLLKRKSTNIAPSVAPDNPWLGIFLPYSPLHHLLMDEIQSPVVATSGNFSDEPIVTDEHEALDRLGGFCDY